MPYQLISIEDELAIPGPVLGISYQSVNSEQIFQPIYITLDQALENLKTLLLTRIGERYAQPDFGTFLLNVIFQPIDENLKEQISDLIIPQVSKFLPYITISNIDVITQQDDPILDYLITIKITFFVDSLIETPNTITISTTENGALLVE